MRNDWKSFFSELKEKENKKSLEPNDKVLIVDSMNTFLRCFAIINHVNPQAEHIGGLTGFLKSIAYAIRITKPTKVILVFDGQGSITNKRYLYPDYKANRDIRQVINWSFESKEEETEAMTSQLARLVDYLKLLPVHLLSIDKIEADDVIGHLCNECSEQVIIMSADRDFLQLVNDKISVYSPTKKKFYTPAKVLEEYKVLSENFLYYKVLLGDKGDNIPGIKGIADKKILKLYPELGTRNIDLNYIKSIAEEKKKDNKLYEKIIERNNQLDINLKLMDLKNPNIPKNDLDIINSTVASSNISLDTFTFLKMYKMDLLGDSIPNVNLWLEDNFRYLTAFKQN